MSHLILQEDSAEPPTDSPEILVPPDTRNHKQPARITVVEQVYFQPEEGPPTVEEARYARKLSSNEQPYSRTYHVDDRWKPLDRGWIEESGLVLIYNLQGHETSTIPTQESRDELAKKVLEIVLGQESTCSMLLGPGESMRFYPSDINQLSIRGRSGKTKLKVVVHPR